MNAKVATFWPEGTTADDVKNFLEEAMKAIDPVPGPGDLANLPPQGVADFGQKDVRISVGGNQVEVRVGFELYTQGMNQRVKITQFYRKSGPGLETFSPSQLRAISRALPPL